LQKESHDGAGKPRRGGLTAKHVLIALIVIGLVLRVGSFVNRDPEFDANYFITMARSLPLHGEFIMPWGDPSEYTGVPTYSHHYSPLFPVWLDLFFTAFGSSEVVAEAAGYVMSLLALVVIIWTTRNLYGWQRALVVGAIFALDYELIIESGKLYTENMSFLFFTLTMWAILKGLKNDRYIALAGLFAGLAYLCRSALGYFFIIAGVGGFLWRFYYMRWSVFKNKWYLLAIAIFGGIVGGWSLRNVARFGWPNWETSLTFQRTAAQALSDPLRYTGLMLLLAPFFVMVLAMYAFYWLPELRGSLRKWKDEEISGLWLAVFLVPFTLLFIAGMQSFYETERGLTPFLRDRVRYLIFAFLPLVWLAVRSVDFHLDKPLSAILRGWIGSMASIRSRISNVIHGRGSLAALTIVTTSAVITLFAVGGWLAAFLFPAILAVFFRSPRKRLAVFLAVLLLFSVEAGTAQVKFAAADAGTQINSLVEMDQPIVVDCVGWHEFYMLVPFVTDAEDRLVRYQAGDGAPYILSYLTNRTYADYSEFGQYYDVNVGGWISQAFAFVRGSTTEVKSLAIKIWKHI